MQSQILIAFSFAYFTIAVVGEYIPPGPRYNCPKQALSIFPCKCVRSSDVGLYIKCENTNLASLSVGLNNIASTGAPIEELILNKCHVKHLYGTLFFRTKCRILRIQDTDLHSIDEHIFHGINETLQELHIINSSLTEFPTEPFKILGNLTVLNIDHHEITNLSKDIFDNSLAAGRLEKLHLTNGKIGDFPTESFQVLRKLKTLDLHGNAIEQLKKNQFKNLRDVEVLDIGHNSIKKLDSSHIADLTKLSWCNVSHNALSELTRGTFARNSVLRVLNIAHNDIKRLDSNSFRGMRFLRRLYLNDNQISDIGRGTFGAITRIGTINLARNAIPKVDYQMFAQLNYIEILDLAENRITEIQKQSFKDLYQTVINMSHNAIETIENGSFENCANITLLDLSNNMIDHIPRETFDQTSYAYEMQLSFNFLTDLSQVPLHNMTGLRILNVSNNALTTIPKNTFPKLYELHTIDVSHNNISQIANAVFQNLFSLRNLDISFNSLEIIKPPMFGTLPTLLEMNLNNNLLSSIAKGAFVKLASLRYLHLENNFIDVIFEIPISLNYLYIRNNLVSEIPDKTWPSMNALLYLDLSQNKLQDTLSEGSFKGLLTLQTLNLNENGLSHIPHQALSLLSTLQYLHLESNNLTELPKKAFGNLPVVFEVNMFNNSLTTISQHAFSGLLQLITLNMSSNALRTITNEAFFNLVSLRHLDLSHNSLEKLDNKTHGLLDDCLSLETINLSHNRFSFITRKMFPSNIYIPYKLYEIDLSYNLMPVLTFDLTFGTRKVRKLNLSHNTINDIRKGVLGNLTSLQTLDLSYNGLEDLEMEPNIFNLPENLTELNLSNNKLFRIPGKSIEKAGNLSVLDLSNNELDHLSIEIINKVKDGMILNFKDNPLNCNCKIRPLSHYLATLTDPAEMYKTITCFEPKLVEGQPLLEVPDEYLGCDPESAKLGGGITLGEFGRLPDVRFRDIFYNKGKLFLTWYVTAPHKDIADFYINIRDKANTVLIEQHVPYDQRSHAIFGKDISPDFSDPLQLCVQAKNSDGSIGSWFDTQCQNLPKNFEDVKNRYDENGAGVYTIVSSRAQRNKMDGKSRSSATLTKISSAVLLTAIVCVRIVL